MTHAETDLNTSINSESQMQWASKALGALMWVTLSIVISVKVLSDFRLNFGEANYYPCLLFGCLFWISWAILRLLIIQLSKYFYGKDRNWIRFLVAHLIAGTLIALLNNLLMMGVFQLFYRWSWFPTSWYPLSMILLNFSIYVAIVAIENSVDLRKRNVQLELQKARLDAELANSRLQALKMQLHPHFFFNSLNTVRMLIETDHEKAARMTTLLGSFLRSTLDSNEDDEVTLEKELEFVQEYLEIQQIRFEDRISVQFDIDDNARKALVPYLVLQPIIENAMLHGCGKSLDCGSLSISARCIGAHMVIKVQDSGCGEKSDEFVEGIGLSNSKSRLDRLYGDRGRISISSLPLGGTLVEFQIPLSHLDDLS